MPTYVAQMISENRFINKLMELYFKVVLSTKLRKNKGSLSTVVG